ncbi:MAG: hypothetical protein NT159_17100 [Proteobacteria bacterium]|nr:hypothetical protein [Pseudomonadota bacterium]
MLLRRCSLGELKAKRDQIDHELAGVVPINGFERGVQMSLRYGIRLGRSVGMSGGGGVLVFYILSSLLEFSVVTIVKIGVAIIHASGWVIQSIVREREFRKKHQDDLGLARRIEAERQSKLKQLHEEDVALAHRISAQRVQQIEYLRGGHTSPPALWGVYLIEPSCGSSYAKCGRHPKILKELWLENRQGTVHELLILPDKPMAVAAVDLLTRGVFKPKSNAISIVGSFAANGMPILRRAQPKPAQADTLARWTHP